MTHPRNYLLRMIVFLIAVLQAFRLLSAFVGVVCAALVALHLLHQGFRVHEGRLVPCEILLFLSRS